MKTTSPWTACVGDGREGRRRSKSGGLTAVRRFVFDPHDTLEYLALEVEAFPTLFNSAISSFKLQA